MNKCKGALLKIYRDYILAIVSFIPSTFLKHLWKIVQDALTSFMYFSVLNRIFYIPFHKDSWKLVNLKHCTYVKDREELDQLTVLLSQFELSFLDDTVSFKKPTANTDKPKSSNYYWKRSLTLRSEWILEFIFSTRLVLKWQKISVLFARKLYSMNIRQ